jgi:hypothetical protein
VTEETDPLEMAEEFREEYKEEYEMMAMAEPPKH